MHRAGSIGVAGGMSATIPTLLYALGARGGSIHCVLVARRDDDPYASVVGASVALLFATLLAVRVTDPPASWRPATAGFAAVLVVLTYYAGWKAGVDTVLRAGGRSDGRRTSE